MMDDSKSSRKATPHVKVRLRNVTTRNEEAPTTTLGNAAGCFISFSMGSTKPSPSKEKNTLAANMTVSATSRRGIAAAAMPLEPTCTKRQQPAVVPTTTATTMATMPSLFRPLNCETSRSMAMPAKTGAKANITTLRPRKGNSSAKYPATMSTKQQQTPPCTMKTKMSDSLRPHTPRALCTTSPRSCTLGWAIARLHSASTSMV
mmetsp:Transcript_14437/g.29286  ORF Transcript_14437/g.29286 Transcript_14437/m.29286 type:complete len:204 (+) Transcript_14437:296-907(+)